MKWINFKKKVGETNIGTADKPIFEPVLQEMSVEYSPENEAIVKQIAYGEPEIYDDDQPDPVAEPTTEELLNTILGVTV
jgi:hypothetical protein